MLYTENPFLSSKRLTSKRWVVCCALLCMAGLGADVFGEGAEPRKFRDRKGNVILTNRSHVYRNKPGMQDLGVILKPIKVPSQYRGVSIQSPRHIRNLIQYYARRYRLDENLVFAVIQAESAFNPNAKSSAGACGLMQLMPGTAAEMGVKNIFDPAENIAGGSQYLSQMLRIFKGDVRLALAAYNAGPNTVKRYGGIPPYAETQNYVTTVLKAQKAYLGGGKSYKEDRIQKRKSSGYKSIRIARDSNHRFTIYFHSGLSQPADGITDKDPYYEIEINRRSYIVRKVHVKEIKDQG
jgi:hypothetical protein